LAATANAAFAQRVDLSAYAGNTLTLIEFAHAVRRQRAPAAPADDRRSGVASAKLRVRPVHARTAGRRHDRASVGGSAFGTSIGIARPFSASVK
jgi:hypothetical protein